MTYRLVLKLKLNIVKSHFRSDSKLVSAWITSSSTNRKTFVTHRVEEIQDITIINEWSHVRTEVHSADIISRGCDAGQLVNIALL